MPHPASAPPHPAPTLAPPESGPPPLAPPPPPSPARVAAFAVALLVGCALAVAAYGSGTVLLGLPLPIVVAVSLTAQAALQVEGAHRLLGAPRDAWPWHLAYVAPSWVVIGLVYEAGGSAFYAHATVVLTVMLGGGALAATLALRVRAPAADAR